jgi:hypothetical protein
LERSWNLGSTYTASYSFLPLEEQENYDPIKNDIEFLSPEGDAQAHHDPLGPPSPARPAT